MMSFSARCIRIALDHWTGALQNGRLVFLLFHRILVTKNNRNANTNAAKTANNIRERLVAIRIPDLYVLGKALDLLGRAHVLNRFVLLFVDSFLHLLFLLLGGLLVFPCLPDSSWNLSSTRWLHLGRCSSLAESGNERYYFDIAMKKRLTKSSKMAILSLDESEI